MSTRAMEQIIYKKHYIRISTYGVRADMSDQWISFVTSMSVSVLTPDRDVLTQSGIYKIDNKLDVSKERKDIIQWAKSQINSRLERTGPRTLAGVPV